MLLCFSFTLEIMIRAGTICKTVLCYLGDLWQVDCRKSEMFSSYIKHFLNSPAGKKHRILKLGSHRGDHICRLGRRNLIASDSSPKVRRRSIPTNGPHSVLNSSPFRRWVFLKFSTQYIFGFYKEPVYELLALRT